MSKFSWSHDPKTNTYLIGPNEFGASVYQNRDDSWQCNVTEGRLVDAQDFPTKGEALNFGEARLSEILSKHGYAVPEKNNFVIEKIEKVEKAGAI